MATKSLKFLSQSQLQAFESDGFLVLDPMLNAQDIGIIRRSSEVLVDWAQTHRHPEFRIELDGAATGHVALKEISNVHRVGGAPWTELMARSNVLDLFEDLLGPHVRFHHSKLLMKPPREAPGTPWHQGLAQGFVSLEEAGRLRALGPALTPEAVLIASIQYYLDDATAAHGCLAVARGSHRLGLLEDPLNPDRIDRSRVEMPKITAGGALLLHCLTLRSSPSNTSDRWQRIPVYTYFASTPEVALKPTGINTDFGVSLRNIA